MMMYAQKTDQFGFQVFLFPDLVDRSIETHPKIGFETDFD